MAVGLACGDRAKGTSLGAAADRSRPARIDVGVVT
jgi:hypothetical protein